MRLIEKLERKLSFRRKNCDTSFKKFDMGKENVQSSVKVSESEFSRFIRFNNYNLVQQMSDFSYKMVDIKLRNRYEPICNLPQHSSDHQHSLSIGCKEKFDVNHIYDVIITPSSRISIDNNNNNNDIHNVCEYSRNRIRTNPWYNSRNGLNQKQSEDIHHYEYIDYKPKSSRNNLSTFDRPIKNHNNFFESRKKLINAINKNNDENFDEIDNVCYKRKLNTFHNQDDVFVKKKRKTKNEDNDDDYFNDGSSPMQRRKRCRKIDRLKSELKEIVHVAIREAKKEHLD